MLGAVFDEIKIIIMPVDLEMFLWNEWESCSIRLNERFRNARYIFLFCCETSVYGH